MLQTDGDDKFTGLNTEFVKHAIWMLMRLQNLGQGRHNNNHTIKCEIGFLAKHQRRQMTKKVIPKRLWYFGLVYEDELLSGISRSK